MTEEIGTGLPEPVIADPIAEADGAGAETEGRGEDTGRAQSAETDPPEEEAERDGSLRFDDVEDGEEEPADFDDDDQAGGRPRKLSSSQRKSRKIARLADELARKETRIADLTRQLEALSEGEEPAPEPPQPEDFADEQDYQQALAAHTTRDIVRAVRQQDRQQATYQELLNAEQERQLLARQHFSDRLEIARPQLPDFEAKVRTMIGRLEAADATVPGHVIEEIQTSGKGPEILYMMAGDDGFLVEMLRSDPVSAARAIGRREAMLAANTRKTNTTAPAPRRALKGGSDGQADPDSMTYQAYRRWRGFDGAPA